MEGEWVLEKGFARNAGAGRDPSNRAGSRGANDWHKRVGSSDDPCRVRAAWPSTGPTNMQNPKGGSRKSDTDALKTRPIESLRKKEDIKIRPAPIIKALSNMTSFEDPSRENSPTQ